MASGWGEPRAERVAADRAHLGWARIAAARGLLPGVTRFGDELAPVRSALTSMLDWTWDGARLMP